MIVTVTPNPSLDRTLEVDRLVHGAVHRTAPVRLDAGGKGVNVARGLAANGVAVRAVFPAGGADGGELTRLLDEAGIDYRAVPIAQAVRTNVSVVEPDGTTTKLNTPGPQLSAHELEALLVAAVDADGDGWVACCGSLPDGAPGDLYADLVTRLHATGRLVAVDTSGPALTAALAAGPDLVKPNAEELAEAVGMPVVTLGDVVAAAEELRARGAGAVLTSLGPDGAVLVDAAGAIHGTAPARTVRSTVGAGDAMLAGFLAGGGRGEDALAGGLAWGAAAVALPGTRMPTPADLDRASVRLHDRIDALRVVHEGARA